MAFFLIDWIYYHACGSFPSSPGTCSLKSERWQQTIYTLHHRRFYHSVHAAATFRYPQWRVLSCEMTATHFKRFLVPFKKSILQQQEVTTPADPATFTSAAGLPCIPVTGIRIQSLLSAGARKLFSQQNIFWGLGTHSPTALHPSLHATWPPQIKSKAILPPFKLASTKMRMVLTQSSKFSGVTWAASRTMKDRDSTHFMRDFVSCGPKSSPTVRLYWLTRGDGPSLLSPALGLEVSMSSFPTCRAQQEGSRKG